MIARWRWTSILAAALVMGWSAAAQNVPQDVQTPPEAQRPLTTSAGSEKAAPTHRRRMGIAILGGNKLDPEDQDLTFLPELLPTDGVLDLAQEKSGDEQIAREAKTLREQPLLMDRAVAVIDGEVILESDVREEQHFAVFEPFSVPGGEFSPLQAMRRMVNRTLILQQMAEQQIVPVPADAVVDQQIDDLRKHLPACAGQQCETAAGWQRFLAAHGFSEGQLHTRWKERMQILAFIEVRFRTGIRISKGEIETYYKHSFVPEFVSRKMQPPPLAKVSQRIDEVLLQQHVNVLLNDYLRSLKDAGNVQILDPKYNELGNAPTPAANGKEATPPEPNGGEQ